MLCFCGVDTVSTWDRPILIDRDLRYQTLRISVAEDHFHGSSDSITVFVIKWGTLPTKCRSTPRSQFSVQFPNRHHGLYRNLSRSIACCNCQCRFSSKTWYLGWSTVSRPIKVNYNLCRYNFNCWWRTLSTRGSPIPLAGNVQRHWRPGTDHSRIVAG